jgi:predicted nucleic acid-binding protein
VRFWDSSAIVPLFVEEPRSKSCRPLLHADSSQLVWCLSRTEVTSAVWRLAREGVFSPEQVRSIDGRVAKLAARWHEVTAVEPVREIAERALRSHALRAADALQLAAALVAVDQQPRGRPFVVADGPLGLAAEREGFDVVRPSAKN